MANRGPGDRNSTQEGEERTAKSSPAVPPLDRERALRRLLDLLSISGPTGEELPVREHLVSRLLEIGVPSRAIRVDDAASRIALPSNTGNLIVTLPGTVKGPRRLLLAHMDTVPLARNAEPVVRQERIFARGKTALGGDDRTGVAAILTALAEVLRGGLPHPPLTFLFTVREESGLRGAAAVRLPELGGPALALNFDGGLPEEVTIGATGAMRMEIEVRGIAAHAGAHPERGVSAVAIFGSAAAELDRNGWLGLIRRPEGTGTSNIGAVSGGEATNVVTDRVSARAEARSHQPEFLARITEEYRRAFSAAAAAHRNESGKAGEAEVRAEESYGSFLLEAGSPVVEAALAAVRAIGLEPRTRISNGGLDANQLTRAGLPTVSLGCGQHEIHTVEEYVVIDEFLNGCRLALAVATG
jgi:tripeptide aminopeptidase